MTLPPGVIPESWDCIDCGFDTAPGVVNRKQLEVALMPISAEGSANSTIDDRTEVYAVRDKVWRAAKMERHSGCLCIGCLEKRIGRRLKPEDFPRNNPLNSPTLPGTDRLLSRRWRRT